MVTFLASILVYILLLSIPVMWWIDGRKLKENTLHSAMAAVLAWAVSQMLKEIFDTTRPYILEGLESLTIIPPTDGAFPSSHTAASMALAVSIYLHNKKLGMFFIVASTLVGMARVWANVHYPIDILGGAVIGIGTAMVVQKVHLRT